MAKLTTDQVLALLVQAGVPQTSSALGQWLARAKAESGLDPSVVNSIGATGLFQILQPLHVKTHPTWTTSWLQNPQNNVAAAKELSSNWTNTGPWAASRLGTVANTPASVSQASEFLNRAKSSGTTVSGQASSILGKILGAFPGGSGIDLPGIDLPGSSTLDQVGGLVNSLSNPRTWLRVAYGAIGIALIVGAAVVLARPVVQPVAKAASKAL